MELRFSGRNVKKKVLSKLKISKNKSFTFTGQMYIFDEFTNKKYKV